MTGWVFSITVRNCRNCFLNTGVNKCLANSVGKSNYLYNVGEELKPDLKSQEEEESILTVGRNLGLQSHLVVQVTLSIFCCD